MARTMYSLVNVSLLLECWLLLLLLFLLLFLLLLLLLFLLLRIIAMNSDTAQCDLL